MFDKSDQIRLQKLLSDTIPLLCKNSLGCQLAFSVEALIGITIGNDSSTDDGEVLMVSFKQSITAAGCAKVFSWAELPSSVQTAQSTCDNSEHSLHHIDDHTFVPNTSWTETDGANTAANYELGWQDSGSWSTEYENNGVRGGNNKRSQLRDPDAARVKTETEDDFDCIKIESDCDGSADLKDPCNQSETVCSQDWAESYDQSSYLHGTDDINMHESNVYVSKSYPRTTGKFPYRTKAKRLYSDNKGAARYRSSRNSSAHAPMNRFRKIRTAATLPSQQPAVESEFGLAVMNVGEDDNGGAASNSSISLGSDMHSPMYIAPTAARPNPTKRCRVCYMAKIRREVRFCCAQCPDRPGLCMQPCFQLYHRMMSVSPDKICSGIISNGDEGPVPGHSSEVDATVCLSHM